MTQEGSSIEMGTSDQVLVASKKSKKIIYVVGFVAMLAVIAVIVTLVVVLSGNEGDAGIVTTTVAPTTVTTTTSTTTTTTTPAPPPTTVAPEPTETPVPDPPISDISLDDILNGEFSPSSFSGTWVSGSRVLYRNANGHLVVHEVDTDSPTILVPNTSLVLQNSTIVNELSPDGRYVALSYNEIPVYRHSFLAQYAVVDSFTNEVYNIVPPVLNNNQTNLQNFRWGPSGSLAFVYDNNIYYQSSLTSSPVALTTSGENFVIYNGVPDWVYEEEVFSSNNAMWFSSDGSRLAYATFDDTNVRIMKIPTFGVPGSVDYQYTYHREIRYPKSGTVNPTVTVSIRLLETGAETVYSAPTNIDQPILKYVTFVNTNTVALMWSNRVQTEMVVELCTQGTAACQRIFSYTQNNGWIDNIPLIFNQQGNAFVTILPFAVNNVLYKQVVQVSQGATAAATWTLSGRTNTPHTVLEIMALTSDNVVWYKATSVNDSSEQHIYSVSGAGAVACFSCDVTRGDARPCLYNDAVINDDASRLALTCAGPDVPQVFIYDVNGTRISTWEDNAKVSELINGVNLPETITLTIPLGNGLPDARALIQAPHDYASRSNVPLLVYVYAGPDTALVTKRWNVDWGTSLVSRYNIAVARIDGRGSGLQGVDQMFAVNRQLGTAEVDDQITVTRLLQQQLPWLDGNRTCIWGWSYGGYAASLALARADVFRCAVAVAPVVDWRFYDTIYTERYMGTPQQNPEGYLNSSLLTHSVVESYRNKRYFLVHGTEDDNVHYQHAMLLSRALQRSDVYFTQMSYTDEDHSLGGVRHHLYHGLEKFLRENML